jgi:hypothetical protein
MRDTRSSRKGQSLVEFCLLLPSFLGSLMFLFLTGIKAILPYLLSLDLFDLARAHLYGVDQGVCEASSYWPQDLFEIHFDCSEMPQIYIAEAYLKWNETRLPVGRVVSSLWGAQ